MQFFSFAVEKLLTKPNLETFIYKIKALLTYFSRIHNEKTLLAAALLAATSYATAATDVTLYGVLDAGVTVSKVHGGDTKVQMSNGNWMGNRWGIKGSEDLGSGNSVSSNWNKVIN